MKSNIRTRLSILMLLGVLFAFLAPFSRPVGAADILEADDVVGAKNRDYNNAWVSNPDWMGDIPDSQSLARLSIPGTHDTMSRFGGIKRLTREFVECQTLTLEEQLNAGVRMIDIRLFVTYNNTLQLHHGRFDLGTNFDDVLNTVSQFMALHPSETVLMRVKQEESDVPELIFAPLVEKYLSNPFFANSFWLPPTDDDVSAPQLGQVRGKFVILQDFGGKWGNGPNAGKRFGLNYGAMPNQDNYAEPNYYTKLFDIISFFLKTQKDLQGGADSNKLHLNYISDALITPDKAASFLNPRTLNYLVSTSTMYTDSNGLSSAGVVMMDFPGPALINKVLSYNYPLKDRAGNTTPNSGVYLYEDTNYSGKGYFVGGCSADMPSYTIKYIAPFNDATSSIRLIGNCKVTLYRDTNLKGNGTSFTSSKSFVGNVGVGNDAASSVKVEPLRKK